MNVDVIYEGLPLARGANARQEDGGLFVELDTPMPVGTRLDVVTGTEKRSGRVDGVVEGIGAGMLIGFGERKHATPEPNAPMQVDEPSGARRAASGEAVPSRMLDITKSAPVVTAPVPSEKAAPATAQKDDEPDDKDPKPKKNDRRKNRRTVIGH